MNTEVLDNFGRYTHNKPHLNKVQFKTGRLRLRFLESDNTWVQLLSGQEHLILREIFEKSVSTVVGIWTDGTVNDSCRRPDTSVQLGGEEYTNLVTQKTILPLTSILIKGLGDGGQGTEKRVKGRNTT